MTPVRAIKNENNNNNNNNYNYSINNIYIHRTIYVKLISV